MANEKGHWVTVNGRHIFFSDDPYEKQEKEIADSKKSADDYNKSRQDKSDPVKGNALYKGLEKRSQDILSMKEDTLKDLNDKSAALYELMGEFAKNKIDSGDTFNAVKNEYNRIEKVVNMGYVNTGRYESELKKGENATPEGKLLKNTAMSYDGTTGTSTEYQQYSNGYFKKVTDFKDDSETITPISKEEYDKVVNKAETQLSKDLDAKRGPGGYNEYKANPKDDIETYAKEAVEGYVEGWTEFAKDEQDGIPGSQYASDELTDSGKFTNSEVSKIMSGKMDYDLFCKFIAWAGSKDISGDVTKDKLKNELSGWFTKSISNAMLEDIMRYLR